jgi:hypothetical protein
MAGTGQPFTRNKNAWPDPDRLMSDGPVQTSGVAVVMTPPVPDSGQHGFIGFSQPVTPDRITELRQDCSHTGNISPQYCFYCQIELEVVLIKDFMEKSVTRLDAIIAAFPKLGILDNKEFSDRLNINRSIGDK